MNRRLIATSALAAAVLALSGCGTDSADTAGATSSQPGSCAIPAGAMGFVVGGRSNTPAIGTSPAQILVTATQAAAANQSSTAVVDTGGRPQVEAHTLTLSAKNSAAREAEQKANTTALQSSILQVAATAPEANPLEALNLAADHIRANGGTGTIVMIDSGLQTTGALDYTTDGMLAATPADVAASLQQKNQLPDLQGITVIMVGVGSTAAPQDSLDTATRHNVQEQWRAIATAAGATCVDVDTTPSTNAAAAGLPAVTPIAVPEVESVIPTAAEPTKLALQFQSNSDQFVDPAAANASLAPIAAWLSSSGTKVLLTGTTATDGTEDGRIALSTSRAEAVKAALVEQGANAEQIQTTGVGTNDPSHVDDLGPNGELLPGPAAQNRLVIVSIQS